METDIYKELLLKYLTGKIDESGTPTEELVNLSREEMTINIKNNITERLAEERNATSTTIVGKIYSDQYENFIIYGNYNVDTSTYGYVCLVNSKLEITSLLTEYTSGTLIYPIISIRQSETGQFYGLTYGTNGSDKDFRVVLFNNILSSGIVDGNYQVIMRTTYIVPNSVNYNGFLYRQNRIIKSLDSPVYYIVLHNTNSKTVFIKFTIQAQAENTWEVFETEYLMDTMQFDVLLDKSSGEEIFYFYGVDILSNENHDIYRSYQLQDVLTPINTIELSDRVSVFTTQTFVIDKDNVYLSASIDENITLYKINGSSLTSIYSFVRASNNPCYLYLEKLNNIIFYKQRNATTTGATISVGLLINDTIEEYDSETTMETTFSYYDYNDFYIFVQYNLVNIYMPFKSSSSYGTYFLVADYNPNNYNGQPYENINSLRTRKGRIINTDQQFIFARNLYNKYIRNNMTLSTLEVPNTLLNNEDMFYIGLIGDTNYYLFSNNAVLGTSITKNIYETLDFNFYNTIRMTDANGSKNIENLDGAIKVNQSTSALLDYHNTQATKARLNFTDGTYNIITIDPATQITIAGNTANYSFIVYVPSNKSVINLEIISYDETTVYATINGDFAAGAFSQIGQAVSIF